MHIEAYKVFCDLAKTGSFTKTAQMNGVSQSAVSQLLGAFERTLKCRLVERGKKRFRLTPEGQVLYDCSKRITEACESLRNKLQDIHDVISGTVRVATIYSIGLHYLPAYITDFMKAYPTVNIHVEYRHAKEVYEDVLSNAADLGLVAYPVRRANLEVVLFRKDRLVLICHPQHPFAGQKRVELRALAGQKFISLESDLPTRKAVDQILKARGADVNSAMEFDNIETLKQAVEIDAGVSIVPQETVTQEIAKRTLAAVAIDGRDYCRPLGILYKKNKVLSPAMKQFVAALKEGGQRPA